MVILLVIYYHHKRIDLTYKFSLKDAAHGFIDNTHQRYARRKGGFQSDAAWKMSQMKSISSIRV
jgi:hypothetical protein